MSHASRSAPPVAELVLRRAGIDDVERLERLENEAFDADRISRRSFRRLVAAPSAILLVAETAGAGPDAS